MSISGYDPKQTSCCVCALREAKFIIGPFEAEL